MKTESSIKIIPHASLSDYTTFRLGGACKALVCCQTPVELENVIKDCVKENKKFILIGGGSNLVVSDSGVDCTVIRYLSSTPLIERDGNDLIVSASTVLDDLAQFAADNNLEGLNYTSGIPGTVGGAIVGNAGAFGKQVGDVLKTVKLISLNGNIKEVSADKLQFTYRNSILKETNDIVVSARFHLTPGDKNALLKEREEILKIRHEKHPDLNVYPCAGSFFRNIEPTSQAGKRQATGWFLEEAGGKNLSVGGAKIYEKHANIIVKANGCRSQDVYDLHEQMKKLIKDAFKIDLVREVRFVGDFRGKNSKEIIW